MNKELEKAALHLKENPEELKDFLRNFDMKTLVKSIKDILYDWCRENMEERSVLLVLETEEHIMGGIGGRQINLINALYNIISDNPELAVVLEGVLSLVEKDSPEDKKIVMKVKQNKIKS